MTDLTLVKNVEGAESELPPTPLPYKDRTLGGQPLPLCESCLQHPAVYRRQFASGEAFLICHGCR